MRSTGSRASTSVTLAAVLALVALGGSSGAWSGNAPLKVLRYDGSGHGPDYSTSVAVASNGARVFVTGSAYAGPIGGDDYTTLAYRWNGTPLWKASYDGPDSNIDSAIDVAAAPDDSRVFVTGYSFGGPATGNDATTVAYDEQTGHQLWVARYDGPGHDTDAGADVVVGPDSDSVYVTGASIGSDGMLDVLTVAYDAATGDERWAARFAGGGGASDEGLAVGISPDGSRVFITGYRTGTTIDFLTVAYDAATGHKVWSRAIDAQGDEIGRALAVAPDGSAVYVTGYRSGAPGEGSGAPTSCNSGRASVEADYITIGFDAATGAKRWIRNYDGPDHDCDEAYGLAVAPDGSRVFVTGSSFSLTTDSDAATVAYDASTGAQLWAARYDGPDHRYDTGDSLVVAPDGSRVYVAGNSTSATTEQDFLTLFYDAARGTEQRVERYDGPGHGFDAPNAIAIHPGGRAVYVTGGSTGASGNPDFATAVYAP